MSDHKLVFRVLGNLCKKNHPLRCETCGVKKKSVIGFLSHKSQCQKTDQELEGLKVMCQLCGRTMLPVSLQRHMDLSHPEKKPEIADVAEAEVLAPRKAASKYVIFSFTYF